MNGLGGAVGDRAPHLSVSLKYKYVKPLHVKTETAPTQPCMITLPETETPNMYLYKAVPSLDLFILIFNLPPSFFTLSN